MTISGFKLDNDQHSGLDGSSLEGDSMSHSPHTYICCLSFPPINTGKVGKVSMEEFRTNFIVPFGKLKIKLFPVASVLSNWVNSRNFPCFIRDWICFKLFSLAFIRTVFLTSSLTSLMNVGGGGRSAPPPGSIITVSAPSSPSTVIRKFSGVVPGISPQTVFLFLADWYMSSFILHV